MHDVVFHLFALAYFMAPAYCANMAPPFVRFWPFWNRPIRSAWFGAHKTVLGFAAGVLAAVLVTAVQAWIAAPFSLVSYAQWLSLGFGFGFGAMCGDTVKSFVKRRLRIPPGSPWVPFDQLDFVVGALIVVGPFARIGVLDVGAILALTFVGDIAVNRISYRLGVKDRPW